MMFQCSPIRIYNERFDSDHYSIHVPSPMSMQQDFSYCSPTKAKVFHVASSPSETSKRGTEMKLAELEREVQVLRERDAQFQQMLKGANYAKYELEKKIQDLEKSYYDLYWDHASLTEERDKLQREHHSLIVYCKNTYEEENRKLTEVTQTLQDQNQRLIEGSERLQQELEQANKENQNLKGKLFQLHNPQAINLSSNFPLPQEIADNFESARLLARRKLQSYAKVREASIRIYNDVLNRHHKIRNAFQTFLKMNLHMDLQDSFPCEKFLQEILQARWENPIQDLNLNEKEHPHVIQMHKILWQASLCPNIKVVFPEGALPHEESWLDVVDGEQPGPLLAMTPGFECNSRVLLKCEAFHLPEGNVLANEVHNAPNRSLNRSRSCKKIK